MKKSFLRFSAASLVACSLFACQKQLTSDTTVTSETSISSASSVSICGLLRTQTPGGWGSEPNGNNPGAYLHANFEAAFGELTVGCPGRYVKLTSAQAITNLLPTGGKAAVLTTGYTNPASIKNVLVGHLVALKLSVGFDAYDANFGQSDVALGNMIIGSGPFTGVTVYNFLTEAERVLGGCSNSAYTIQDVLQTATSINENYVDGTRDNGYLVCPDNGGSDPL